MIRRLCMKKFARVWVSILSVMLIVAFMPAMAFAAGTSADKVKVTMSVGGADQYLAICESVEATGDLSETYFPAAASYEPEGVSLFDVLVAYHIAKYGKDKVTENLGFEDGGGYCYISKAFGVENSSLMTVINGAFANVTNPAVKDGDKVYEGFYLDSTGWSDFYGAFTKDEYTVEEGAALTMEFAGNTYGTPVPATELTVNTVDKETGKKAEVKTTFKDGKAEVTFDKAGTYYVIPTGKGTYEGWSGTTTGPINGDISVVTVTAKKAEEAAPTETKPAAAAKVKAPKKVTIKSAKAGKKKITLTWKKVAKASGYTIKYQKKGAKKWKTITIKKGKTTKKVIKKLKKGTYKIKIRAYIKKSGKTYPGKWSKTKTVKVKK